MLIIVKYFERGVVIFVVFCVTYSIQYEYVHLRKRLSAQVSGYYVNFISSLNQITLPWFKNQANFKHTGHGYSRRKFSKVQISIFGKLFQGKDKILPQRIPGMQIGIVIISHPFVDFKTKLGVDKPAYRSTVYIHLPVQICLG